MPIASGTFDVKLNPQPTDAPIGRMSIDKTFHGDLEGISKGEMLAARSAVAGSAGYVALEKVTATLDGKKGEFFLQHNGLMDRNTPSLVVVVVPDSATGDLQGLSGTMTIEVRDKKHFYSFNYEFRIKN